MKILVAEDTKDLNRVLTVALEHEGYIVDSALDGEEASKLLANNGYDAIVLDIMMPKKNGIEVLTELRANHIVTPVLLLTAKAEVDDRVTGLDAGADDYLTKPFAIKELMARVRALIRRKEEYETGSKQLVFEDIYLDGTTLELKCENAVRLSTKEFELLEIFIKNAGDELSPDRLLELVWRDSRDADRDTVWLYVMYLQNKLRAISSSVMIVGERDQAYSLQISE